MILFNIFWMYMEKGGSVNIMIFIGCIIMMYIGFDKYLHFRRVKKASNLLDIYRFAAGKKAFMLPINKMRPEEMSNNMLREMLMISVPPLEKGLNTMAVLVSISPLLGLLGTVIGMIQTFIVIMLYGVGNPGLLSEGISVSLITTQAGLLVSFPGLLFHNYLLAQKDVLVHKLIAEGERLVKHA